MSKEKNISNSSEPVYTESEMEALYSLYEGMLTLNTPEEMHCFMTDLCSYNELCSMMHRWQILTKIDEGKSYEEIIRELSPSNVTEDEKKTKKRSGTTVSSTTISRVKNCYNNPDGGYRTALDRLKNKADS